MKAQFTNADGNTIANAGTSEGVSKGWATRKGSAPYDQQAGHADRMSDKADQADQDHGRFPTESSRQSAIAAHAKAENAHLDASVRAARGGNKAKAMEHLERAHAHRAKQERLKEHEFDLRGP
jgi:hypothetical protein